MSDMHIRMQLVLISNLRAEVRKAAKALDKAEDGLKELVFDYANENKARFMNPDNVDEWPKNAYDLTLGGWDCEESPTGKCVTVYGKYDEICIFCGQPDERK